MLPGLTSPASRSRLVIAIASVDLVVVAALVSRGVDARMLLLLGAMPLFLLTGQLTEMVVEDRRRDGQLRDRRSDLLGHGVRVRAAADGLRPAPRATLDRAHRARCARSLIPGGILAGYLINTTIVSQSGTAAVLGPVLIPLLRAGGLGPISAGAILLLGSSMGGELFNPGAVEMRKLSELTGFSSAQVVARSARLNLLACATALVRSGS